MSCRSDEEDDAAPQPPGFSTPTKSKSNDGACHAEPDAERMQTKSDANIEKQFDKSTGKKGQYHPFLEYREVGRWATGDDSESEPAEIKQAIKTKTKKFMQDSRLMIAPATDPKRPTLPSGRCNAPNITTRELMNGS